MRDKKTSGAIIGKAISNRRPDLIFVGVEEADILIGSKKKYIKLRLLHPSGGTAYAISYNSQKFADEMENKFGKVTKVKSKISFRITLIKKGRAVKSLKTHCQFLIQCSGHSLTSCINWSFSGFFHCPNFISMRSNSFCLYCPTVDTSMVF